MDLCVYRYGIRLLIYQIAIFLLITYLIHVTTLMVNKYIIVDTNVYI